MYVLIFFLNKILTFYIDDMKRNKKLFKDTMKRTAKNKKYKKNESTEYKGLIRAPHMCVLNTFSITRVYLLKSTPMYVLNIFSITCVYT